MAGKLVLAVGSSLQNCLSVLTVGYVPVCVLTVGYVPLCVSLQRGGLFPSEGAIR